MVAKKRTVTRKQTTTKRRKPSAQKKTEFHPNEAMFAVAAGAALILVSLALVTSV